MRFWDSTIENCYFSESALQIDTWRNCRVGLAVFQTTTIINSGTSVGAEWIPKKGRFENCILVGLDLRTPAFYNCQFVKCTIVMCVAETTPRGNLKIENCRGVLIVDAKGPIREWGYGLGCVSMEDAKRIRKEPVDKALNWNELLLSAFEPDATPKSANEIQSRLKHVDIALLLNRYRGKICLVVSPDTPNGSKCRIISCDGQRVTLRNIATNQEFEPALRRTSVKDEPELVITVVAA